MTASEKLNMTGLKHVIIFSDLTLNLQILVSSGPLKLPFKLFVPFVHLFFFFLLDEYLITYPLFPQISNIGLSLLTLDDFNSYFTNI